VVSKPSIRSTVKAEPGIQAQECIESPAPTLRLGLRGGFENISNVQIPKPNVGIFYSEAKEVETIRAGEIYNTTLDSPILTSPGSFFILAQHFTITKEERFRLWKNSTVASSSTIP
jgi:hypothetical protein